MSATEQAKRLETIRALLAKAERTTFPEEAKAFTAKAEELMIKWAIDDAMLHGARDDGTIGMSTIWLPANEFRGPKVALFAYVATHHDCKPIQTPQRYVCPECHRDLWTRDGLCPMHDTKARRMLKLSFVGFAQDRRFTEVMFTSLLIQAEREFEHPSTQEAMTNEAAYRGAHGNRTGGHNIAWRNAFMTGYASAIYHRLKEIKKRATQEAERTYGPSSGVSIVLADRSKLVAQEFERLFPRLRQVRSSAGRGSQAGQRLGAEAASRADLGQPRVGGNRPALEGG